MIDFEERKNYLGGSDVAAILGVSPWKTAVDVWMDKKGISQDVQKDCFAMGHAMEPVIAKFYEDDTGEALLEAGEPKQYKELNYLRGNADRLILGKPKGLEIKTAGYHSAKEWGEPGTDQIPAHYAAQCLFYMACYNFDSWDIAVSIGGQKPVYYTLNRDKALEEKVIQICADWWVKHILENNPPEFEASESYAAYLDGKFKKNMEPLKSGGSEGDYWVRKLIAVRSEAKKLEEDILEAENHLKEFVGDAEGIECDSGKITWKSPKVTTKIDWSSIAAELNPSADLIMKYTTEKQNSRRFILIPTKGE